MRSNWVCLAQVVFTYAHAYWPSLSSGLFILTLISAIQTWRMTNGPLYTVLLKHNIEYYAFGLCESTLATVPAVFLCSSIGNHSQFSQEWTSSPRYSSVCVHPSTLRSSHWHSAHSVCLRRLVPQVRISKLCCAFPLTTSLFRKQSPTVSSSSCSQSSPRACTSIFGISTDTDATPTASRLFLWPVWYLMSTPKPRQSWSEAYTWVLGRVARIYYALCPKVGGSITQDPEWCDMSSEDRGGDLRVYGGMQPLLVWEE